MMTEFFIRIKGFIKDIAKDSAEHNIATFAASTSFFFFLSLFPMIILFCSLIPYTPLEMEYIVSAINNLVPEVLRPLIISVVTRIYLRSAGTITLSALVTLWTAGRGMMELINAINTANDYTEKRGYLKLRIFSSVYTLAMLFMMGTSLLILVFGRRILKQLLRTPSLENIYEMIRHVLNMQYVYAFVLIFLMILLLFAKLTAVKTPLKKSIPGGFFSTVLWLIFTYLFSVFLEIYNPFTAYGTLATTIILMFWMYFCMYFLILGAVVNKNFKNRGKRSEGDFLF